jgi:Cu-processing system ATP-binding protein
MIEIRGLNKRFGNFVALKDIHARFSNDECIALIGPNGSGKTTLIKSLLGMVIPEEGQIFFEGNQILGSWEYRKRIGYMPQAGRYPENMSIDQLFTMMRDIRKNDGEDKELYDLFDIESIKSKALGTLSGGMKQKVNASLAFLFDPNALILDEPTAGLDPVSSEILKAKISKECRKSKLIIITSHVLSDLEEFVSRVVFIQDGVIRFSKNLTEIKTDTGEHTLSKAIAKIMSA